MFSLRTIQHFKGRLKICIFSIVHCQHSATVGKSSSYHRASDSVVVWREGLSEIRIE